MNTELLGRLSQLDARQRELFLKALQDQIKSTVDSRSIPEKPARGPLPLTFAQERLWFLNQRDPESPFYNVGRVFNLEGDLSVEALGRSLAEVVRRHEILRTRFPSELSGPVQQIASSVDDEMTHTDVRGSNGKIEAYALATQEVRRPFDVTSELPWRAQLIQYGDAQYLFVLVLHHIAVDGWSLPILFREISQFYRQFHEQRSFELSPLEHQYVHFALWERMQWGERSDLEKEELGCFWRNQLQGIPEVLPLPTDSRRALVAEDEGAVEPVMLSSRVTSALKKLAADCGVTLATVLLAGFQALLARYMSQNDVVVAQAISNRGRTEFEELIGLFVNTIPFRTDLSSRPTFAELIERVHQVVAGAYAHQHLPFEMIVERAKVDHSQSFLSLTQVMFGFDSFPEYRLELEGVTATPIGLESIHNGRAKADLTLWLTERAGHLTGTIEYKTGLFNPSTIQRLWKHLALFLEHGAVAPDTRVDQVPILSSGERHQIASEWNRTRSEFPREQVLAELFEEQVEARPDAVAVETGEEKVSYAELNGRANRWAHYLISLGVGPDVPVAVHAGRSIEVIVALLGILKAGGAYVPLDPRQPGARLEMLLAEIRPAVVLSEGGLQEAVPGGWPAVRMKGEQTEAELKRMPADNPGRRTSAENLAYVMYTSGSTGRPKGVAVTQRNVVRLVRGAADYVKLGPEEVLSQIAPLAFDASTFEIWGALLQGGRLVVVSESVPTARDIGRAISLQQVTTMWLTASLFNAVADESVEELAGVRQLLIGGEALSVKHVNLAREALPGTDLINGYGPTEGTTFSCCYKVKGDGDDQGRGIPIGRPISNATAFVLDETLELTPVGVEGELYIGGEGLARCYWERPNLTAEKFVSDPFSGAPGARLYRSGDRVRWRQDGTLEFIGRRDGQIKLRGFRIELGEVETVLRNHFAVRGAVALLREDRADDKRLVAYVTSNPGVEEWSTEKLGEHLESLLPAYMVPSAIVVMKELPLTPNGKIDYRALPVPQWERGELAEPRVLPRNTIELELAQIWGEVLGIEKDELGVFDNFFALGGHSLLAMQIVVRARTCFKAEFPLRWIFEDPTIARLAQKLAPAPGLPSASQDGAELLSPPIVKQEQRDSFPLSFAQQRLWFIDGLTPETSLYNVPILLRLRGPLSVEALRQSVQDLGMRHEVLRTRYAMLGGELRQKVESEHIVLEVRDCPDEEAAVVEAQREARRPFDLERGPLLRAVLLRIGQEDHILVLNLHHSIADGWSIQILSRELRAAYEAHLQGRGLDLPELPIQYGDFAAWHLEWVQGEVLNSQLPYWRRQLDGVACVELASDQPRPPRYSYSGDTTRRRLPNHLTESLRELSRAEDATLFMTLLAAFQALLVRYTGQTDVAVGTPIAGRNQLELEPLIGFFVNTLVMRTRAQAQWTFRRLLQEVREVALGAYANQDVPFEKLVEELQPERDLSRTPLFQVMFVVDSEPVFDFELLGLNSSQLDLEWHLSKFDLTVAFLEDGEGAALNATFRTDLFERATIDRLLGHYESLLQAVAADQEQRLWQLPLMSEPEMGQLRQWSAASREYEFNGRGQTIVELFEEQVEARPDAVAVSFEGQALSYRELNERVNQQGNYLRQIGVGRDVLVGVLMERSLEMVVGLLGILKAGGAYVPLDPESPPERLCWMVGDAGVEVVLTQEHFRQRLPTGELVRVIAVEAVREEMEVLPRDNLRVEVDGANLAYMIYTSGSTGQPKGAMNTQHGIANRLLWMQAEYELSAGDVVIQKTPYSFDVSVWEFFWPLISGAKLVVARPGGHRESDYLAGLIAAEGVTTIHFVPAMLGIFLEEERILECRSLRRIICSGEALGVEQVGRVFERLSWIELHNLYGPTEAAVDVTSWRCANGSRESRVPIGRPIANTEIYILDRWGLEVPVGVSGELYIGGAGLARGYWARADMTAERFIPHPYSPMGGERLYRTGDVARLRADEAIEYLGRMDHQIKLRGHRIEAGEIEAILKQHAGVREVVVMERGEGPDKRLVAYVECEGEGGVGGLKEYLRAKLPDYMVPQNFVGMERLPLTANGKIDRKALAESDATASQPLGGFTPPTTWLECQIALIWEKFLPIEKAGVEDNFFDVGGHSLLAARVLTSLKAIFPSLTLIDLFSYPTIRALAEHLVCQGAEASPADEGASRAKLRLGLRERQPQIRRAALQVQAATED